MRWCISLCLCFWLAPSVWSQAKPNIVFILCDDLGYGDVKCYNSEGKIATPRLDQLAREGMRFTDAHTASSVCTPTRYALMTGRYAWRTRLAKGVLGGYSPPLIDEGRMTVAGYLQSKGYTTGCVGKWHLGWNWPGKNGQKYDDSIIGDAPKKGDGKGANLWNVDWSAPITRGPIANGFDFYFGISASLDMPPFVYVRNDRVVTPPTITRTYLRTGPASEDFLGEEVVPSLVREANGFLDRQTKSQKPFFLYVPLTSPHTPILPTKQWQGKSGLNSYADFVMQTDAAIGEIMDTLQKNGQANNTLVIVTSDNGCSPQANYPELLTKGHNPSGALRGTKADTWEGGHRVPFIVRWPGQVAPGSICDQLVGLQDLFATSVELCGEKQLPQAQAEDSLSFLPLLQEPTKPVRKYLIQHSIQGKFCLREDSWKLILAPGSGGWSEPKDDRARKGNLPEEQLYNLGTDLAEKKNLASAEPERLQKMKAKLLEIIGSAKNDREVKP